MNLLDGYVTRDEAASALGVTKRSLINYENEPNGLPRVPFGGRVYYRVESLREWLAKRERQLNPTSSVRRRRMAA